LTNKNVAIWESVTISENESKLEIEKILKEEIEKEIKLKKNMNKNTSFDPKIKNSLEKIF